MGLPFNKSTIQSERGLLQRCSCEPQPSEPQVIGCCAQLQLLIGKFGRPGGGIMALRGLASIQGPADIPTSFISTQVTGSGISMP